MSAHAKAVTRSDAEIVVFLIEAGRKLAGGAVASAASNVAQGTSRAAGGATMAYALGSAGKSGGAAVAGGARAVGEYAASTALFIRSSDADQACSTATAQDITVAIQAEQWERFGL